MEKAERSQSREETVRARALSELVDCIAYRKDAELACHLLSLSRSELTARSSARLISIIAEDPTVSASEFAYRVLRDNPALDECSRDVLLRRIVLTGDRTTCSLALERGGKLGGRENELREIVAKKSSV